MESLRLYGIHHSLFQPASENHDAVQQFCEKHMDKVKSYVDSIKGKLPIPIKATLDGKYGA